MANRVAVAIALREKTILDRLARGLVTQDKVTALHKELDMDLGEYVKFQEHKSLAVASGKLSTEEGMTIYRYLGNTPETFNGQSVAVKSVLTGLFAELLKMSLQSRGVAVPA